MFLHVGSVFECWRCFPVFLDVESVFSVFGCFKGVFPTLPRFFPVIYPSNLLLAYEPSFSRQF